MVAEAMTETTLGEDTRHGIVVSQVGKERVQVRKAHSLIGRVDEGYRKPFSVSLLTGVSVPQ